MLQQYPIISEQISRQSLAVVLREFEQIITKQVPGDIVEFGCYIGTTTLFLRRLIDHYHESDQRKLYAYDSFAGLPAKLPQDNSGAGEQFKAGELSVSKAQFLWEFHKARLQPPITTKGWFNELEPDQVPDQIAFAFLDGDFYSSIRDSLELVWPRLTPGGVIAIDDYERAALPGATRAVTEFFKGKAVRISHEQGIGIVHTN